MYICTNGKLQFCGYLFAILYTKNSYTVHSFSFIYRACCIQYANNMIIAFYSISSCMHRCNWNRNIVASHNYWKYTLQAHSHSHWYTKCVRITKTVFILKINFICKLVFPCLFRHTLWFVFFPSMWGELHFRELIVCLATSVLVWAFVPCVYFI